MNTRTRGSVVFRTAFVCCFTWLLVSEVSRASASEEEDVLLYQPPAELTNVWSMFLAEDYEAVVADLDRDGALERGHASFLRALLFDFGLGVGREPKRAAFWYDNALRKGVAYGALGLLDQAVSAGDEDAAIRLQSAAYVRRLALGEAALLEVGPFHFGSPDARARNLREAIAFNRRRALGEGQPWAMANVASLLEDGGNHLVMNVFRLSQVYRMKSHELHAAASLSEEAFRYRYGLGVQEDAQSAIGLYRLAAHQGRLESQISLAQLLLKTNEPERIEEGLSLLEEVTVEDPSEREELAEVYWDGEIASRDLGRTRRLLREAADAGDAHAASEYGRFCENGWGGDADIASAETYFRKAAAGGSYWGSYHYGWLLIEQAQSSGEAMLGLRWLERAALLENADAMRDVAGLYRNGHRFIQADEEEAKRWLEWSLAHDQLETLELQVASLFLQYANESGMNLAGERRLWEAASRAMAAGSLSAVKTLALMLYDQKSTRHDPQFATTLLEAYADQDIELLELLYSRLALGLDGEDGKDEAWALLQKTSLPVDELKLFHMALFPEYAEQDLVSWVSQSLAEGGLPVAYANLGRSSSLEDFYERLAETIPLDYRNGPAGNDAYTVAGRKLWEAPMFDPNATPLRHHSIRLSAHLDLVVGPSGDVLRVRVDEHSHPFAAALFARCARQYKWEPSKDPEAGPIRVKLPFVWLK